MNLKGSLPLLVLHVLAHGPNHGYAIAATIRRLSEGVLEFREGTLYPALHTLEAQGLIETFEEVIAEGRPRRIYRLTEAGARALERERAAWRQYSRAINAVLDTFPRGSQ
ncbi:MAG: PadR family transcriptional regulator [Oscillochloridaceae bacterium]|nr:PadR family transcriptional regulator [Chloroflexaceae bacterium]MDW8392037.1 PadR family transcriptional regulator [Oscillochloridaceae bacterium]